MPSEPLSDISVAWGPPSADDLALARLQLPGCHVMANSCGITVIMPSALKAISEGILDRPYVGHHWIEFEGVKASFDEEMPTK